MVVTGHTPRRPAFTVLLGCSLAALMFVSIYGASLHLTHNESILDGIYGFGPAIQGIVQNQRLGAINPNYGWWCYACRMPLVPLLSAAGYWLSPKMAVFLLFKNLVSWSLWIYAFFRLKRHFGIPNKWALVTPLLLLLAPYNLSIAGWPDVEEGYLFALLGLLFSLLLTLRGSLSALGLGSVLAAIYLTKSSMLPLCLVSSLWIIIQQRRSPRLIAIPLVSLALAMFGWGIYVHSVSGVFAFGSTASSWNGWNFYKGNNPYAYPLYPRISLDVLDDDDSAHKLLPRVPVHNEWELNRAQIQMARGYIAQNPGTPLKMGAKKLFVACCDVKESPEETVGRTRGLVILSNLVSHLMLACVFLLAIVNFVHRQASQAEILVVCLAIAYVVPYFAAFLYMRHMVPIYGVMAVTAGIQLARRCKQASVRDEIPAGAN